MQPPLKISRCNEFKSYLLLSLQNINFSSAEVRGFLETKEIISETSLSVCCDWISGCSYPYPDFALQIV